jgi:hypothetical protein
VNNGGVTEAQVSLSTIAGYGPFGVAEPMRFLALLAVFTWG